MSSRVNEPQQYLNRELSDKKLLFLNCSAYQYFVLTPYLSGSKAQSRGPAKL